MGTIRENTSLVDISSAGRERPWNRKKQLLRAIELAVESSDLPDALKIRAQKIGRCADSLWFRQSLDTGEKELDSVWFCRQRLCAICQWRLSLRKCANLSKAIECMNSPSLVFLTLTVRNCNADELRTTIDTMRKNFIRMYNQRLKRKEFKHKPVRGFCKGFYYTVEVSYNHENDTYHPHLHVLLDVTSSYFNKEYLNMNTWRELWKSFMEIDYMPQVDAKTVKGLKTKGGILEITKYLTKPSSYITFDDLDFTAQKFEVLQRELGRCRTTATSGTFREMFRTLKLNDDIKTANLMKLGKRNINENYALQRFDFNGTSYELSQLIES